MKTLKAFGLALLLALSVFAQVDNMNRQTQPAWMKDAAAALEKELVGKYGEAQRTRAARGLRQAASFWREEDGDRAAFERFVRENFAGEQKILDALFNRFEYNLERLIGHLQEINREFRTPTDLDTGELLSFDDVFAGYDPSAHVTDDFFANRLAFTVLLNFPLTTLEERTRDGEKWSRRQWAEARLAARFSRRVPSAVNLEIARAANDAGRYIAEYNIWMHHLVDDRGERIFPAKLRLLSHWNLRDEIKANYSETGQPALAKQRMIQKVMEHIVNQTIPAAVVDNPGADWNPFTNEVRATTLKANDGTPKNIDKYTNAAEPDTRYARLLGTFQASRREDAFSPTAPTLIARRFDEQRELSETRVQKMLEEVLSSPMVAETAKLISQRLNRKLEPFDIWYNGFKPRGAYSEAQLDEIVARRYPTAEAFQKDIPNILVKLGFTKERAAKVAANIVVEPSRGSGHAMGAAMRSAKVRLRTRVEKGGMNYKGYNIAVHELGHNVEQTFSLNEIDYYSLGGVPNNAFTEALAFVFQEHDLELLGLAKPDEKQRALQTLNDFWSTYEISGVALVEMQVWHWLYDHPNATPAELKAAVVRISKEVWNKYYAPVFGRKDVVLLGIYSHMIDTFLYLPDYPIGYLIAFQIKEQMEKAGNLGAEFERMTTVGSIAPDLWMKKATGSPVTPEPLLEATKKALLNFGT
jgi:hypothetical protein